jgi:hypothetical protein
MLSELMPLATKGTDQQSVGEQENERSLDTQIEHNIYVDLFISKY